MHISDVIQDLVKSERNQQVMCENGLPQRLLHMASAAFADEDHPLHGNLQHMLERLASQALEPKDLRLAIGCASLARILTLGPVKVCEFVSFIC